MIDIVDYHDVQFELCESLANLRKIRYNKLADKVSEKNKTQGSLFMQAERK